nr:hypothetical protein [Tanacetum cinerariifolium]
MYFLQTASRLVVKKKVIIFADYNIILHRDVALVLGKSISIIKVEEEEAAKQVHATHARIVTESVLESAKKKTGSKSSRSVVIQDTPSAPKPKLATSKPKLKDTEGSSEGTGTIPGVTDESIVVSATLNEGTEEDQLDDEEKDDKEGDDDDEGDDHINDTQDTDDEVDETKSDEDEIYKYKIRVRIDDDVEMINAKVEDFGKGDAEMSNVAKADAEEIKEANDDSKKAKLPPASSSLSISLVSSMLNIPVSVISKPLVLTPIQETPSIAPVTTLPPPSVSTISPAPLHQTTTPIPTPPVITETPTITTVVLEFDTLTVVQLRVAKLEKDVSELKNIALIEDGNDMDKGVADTVKDYKRKHDDDDEPPAGQNQGRKTKRRRTKESESSKKPSSPKETPKGKASLKVSKTGKSASAKEPVKEPITEVVIDDAGKYVVRDDHQPQDTFEPKTTKTLNPEWFSQPPRPFTPNLEWNKRQVVLRQPEQPWFNKMVSAIKDSLTFNDLMATHIDFSKYVLNQLKINNLTQYILLGPAFNLLKGTCTSIIELEYHFQECLNALIDKLDWNNPKGDRYPFDLSKPLPLQGLPGHLTVVVDYFFNNDLEYLKSSNPERMYTTSITKTKTARVLVLRNCMDMVVKTADRQLYTFQKCDFADLHLNDIEDIPLLAVQHKLFHLNESDLVDFIGDLCMFTRSLIIERQVEDLQLGVERVDLAKQKRVMWVDELYKFSNKTLKKVWDELHYKVLDFRLGYKKEMSRRKWTAIDKKRSKLMVELIDKQMRKSQNWRDLPKDIPLVRIEVLMYDVKRSKNIIVMPKSIHIDDGNPTRANIKQARRAQRFANTHDPLALMANTQKPFHPDHSSLITYIQHPQPNNNFVPQPLFNTNYMQQPMQNPKDISDPTTAIDMALALIAKAFTLNNTTATNNNQRSSSNPINMKIAQPGKNMDQDTQMLRAEDNVRNQFRPNTVQNVRNQVVQDTVQNSGIQIVENINRLSVVFEIANQYENGNVVPTPAEGNDAYDEIKKVTTNYNLHDNLQQASTSGTRSDKVPIYDSDGSAEW